MNHRHSLSAKKPNSTANMFFTFNLSSALTIVNDLPRPYRHVRHPVKAMLFALWMPLSVAQAQALSLDDVVELVTERDLEIAQSTDREAMLRNSSKVSKALPPPNLMLSASNFPIDTFDIDQEPMTQIVAKVSQMFPPGDSRRWRAASQIRQAEGTVVQRELRAAMLRQQLYTAWSQAWMAQASVAILESNRAVFEQALETTRASYSAGIRQARQRNVLGAQTALTRLEERIERYSMMLETTREMFGEWLSAAELDTLEFTRIEPLRAIDSLNRFDANAHPSIVLAETQRFAAEAEQQLASEMGKGNRGISLSYGYRDDPSSGQDRADFLSLSFSMDLAALRGNANSARRAAATAKVAQADKEVEVLKDRLSRDFAKLQAQAARLQSRRAVLNDELLPQYRQQADVTRREFASDQARFIELQLVLIDLLNAELDTLALDAELMKTDAALAYILSTTGQSGDNS